jgi:guanosine-3',5'-bis(diphosphate) 3'-pyrophosphohydrolase
MRSTESNNPFGLLVRALAFAAHQHRDQRRKDASAPPYINHPIALAELLVEVGGIDDPVVLAAALLHDTLEDTEATAAELRAAFGAEVAAIVAEVSDDKSLEKRERKRLQVERAAQLSRRAKLVKLADKTCNLRDVADHPPAGWALARRQEYFDWARAVVDGMRGTHAALEAAFDAAYGRRPTGD